MSEVFEGVLFRKGSGDVEPALRLAAESFLVELQTAWDELASISVKHPRQDTSFGPEMERVAEKVSELAGKALLLRYDSRVGYRASALFDHGHLIRSFGADDERWVPLDEQGEPRLDGPTLSVNELDPSPEAEYETVQNAIELGLNAFGSGNFDQFIELVYA